MHIGRISVAVVAAAADVVVAAVIVIMIGLGGAEGGGGVADRRLACMQNGQPRVTRAMHSSKRLFMCACVDV